MLNANMKNWRLEDYVDGYCDMGKEEYLFLRSFIKEHKLGMTNSVQLLSNMGGDKAQNIMDGKIQMFNNGSRYYVSSTNNGQGYNTLEEAKKGVSLVLNPKGNTGRQVEKGTADDGTTYKQVTKYNQQGDVQKSKLKMTTATGDKSVEKGKSGL